MTKIPFHIVVLYKFVFITIVFIAVTYLVTGQEPDNKRDSVLIRKGEYFLIGDSIIYIPGDSIRFLEQQILSPIDSSKLKRSRSFYDSLKIKAGKYEWTSELYNWLFTSAPAGIYEEKTSKSEQEFVKYEGKIIRNIRILELDVFGPVIRDTSIIDTSRISRTLNKIHIKTRERYIRNNLIIENGDEVNPYVLADNERIIRNLPYIEDARIILIPVSDEIVDVLLITKDKFSLGLDLQFYDINSGKLEIYDKNILGIGHELKANLFFDYDTDPSKGYEGVYKIDNIRGSFIKGILNYKNAFNTESIGINLSRKFFTPYTKYAGGINITNTSTYEDLDTLSSPTPFIYGYQDYWLGRSFMLNYTTRSHLIVSGRFLFNNIYERPEIDENSYYYLHNFQLYLGSIAFSRQKYYKSSLIYNYGTTEDIPYGMLLEFTGGYEDSEFYNRYYTGLTFSHGNYYEKLGYLHTTIGFAGFLSRQQYRQGLFHLKSSYFTNLFPFRNYRIRQFIVLDYTIGIRRFEDEQINISNKNGIRGLTSDSLSGTHRLTMSLETVAFSPFYFYGFQFAFYGFTDFGFIGSNKYNIFRNDLYSAIGVGLRIRNERLVFKTFQIRLAFYPRLPVDFSKQFIHISGERLFDPRDFDVHAPGILEFR